MKHLCLIFLLILLNDGLSANSPVGKVFKVNKNRITITGGGIQKLKPGQKVYVQLEKKYIPAVIKTIFHSKAEAIIESKKNNIKPGLLVFLKAEQKIKKNEVKLTGTDLTPEFIRANGIFKKSLYEKSGKHYISPTDGRYVREIPEFPLIYHNECVTKNSQGKILETDDELHDAKDTTTKCRYWLNGLYTPAYDSVSPLAFSENKRHYGYKAKQGVKWHMVVDGISGPAYDWVGWMDFVNEGELKWYYFAKEENTTLLITNLYTLSFADIALVKIEGENNWWARDNGKDRPAFQTKDDLKILVKKQSGDLWKIYSVVKKTYSKLSFNDVKLINNKEATSYKADDTYHACLAILKSTENRTYILTYGTGTLTEIPKHIETFDYIKPSNAIPDILVTSARTDKETSESDIKLIHVDSGKSLGLFKSAKLREYNLAKIIVITHQSKSLAINKDFEITTLAAEPAENRSYKPTVLINTGEYLAFYGAKGNVYINGKLLYKAKPFNPAMIYVKEGQPVFLWGERTDTSQQNFNKFNIYRNGKQLVKNVRMISDYRTYEADLLSKFHMLTEENVLIEFVSGEITKKHKLTTKAFEDNNLGQNFCAASDQGFVCLFENKLYGPFRGEYILNNDSYSKKVLCFRENPKTPLECRNKNHVSIGTFEDARLISDKKYDSNPTFIWAIKNDIPYALGICESPVEFPRSYLDLDFLSDDDRSWVKKAPLSYTEVHITKVKNYGKEFHEYHASNGETYSAIITPNCTYTRGKSTIDTQKTENEENQTTISDYSETAKCIVGKKELKGRWLREYAPDGRTGKLYWAVEDYCEAGE